MKRLVFLLLLLPSLLIANPVRTSSRQLLSHLALKGHERILDLGCGDGTLTAEVAQQVPDGFALGLDRSTVMIRFAEQTYDPELISNLQFQLGNVEALEFQEKFDVACLFDSFQWIDDQKGALAGVARALKQGGKLCLVVPLECSLDRVAAEVLQGERWRVAAAEGERPHLIAATSLMEKIREVELAPIHVETEEHPVCFPSQAELALWLEVHLEVAYTVATDQRRAFIEEVAALYIKQFPDKICVEQPTLSLVAVKR